MNEQNENNLEKTGKLAGQSETDCYAFQCFVHGRMLHDTGLITLAKAKELWASVEAEFTKDCEQGQDAEIAIWMDMEFEGDYRVRYKSVSSSDVVVRAGTAYIENPVFA